MGMVAISDDDDFVVFVTDFESRLCEASCASCVAELPNGEEAGGQHVWEKMLRARFGR